MHPLQLLAWFFGGATLINAIPHLVSGLMGKPFQSPFANPPGEGLSSPTVNVAWGFFNLLLSWLLLCQVGAFDLRVPVDALAAGLGGVMIGLFCARHFGRFQQAG
ncbi:hypothetical protein [Novosphingobium sp.]|uniref:hypothetical protein n=1 Tax=Novosphingobium sp. TaxID=1874826 RepID=UPI0031DF8143